MEADWATTQQRVFTKWVNSAVQDYYGGKVPACADVFEGFKDGVLLARVFEALLSKSHPNVKLPHINERPRTRIERLDNVTQALLYLERCGVKTVFLTPLQVVDGEHNMILGLVWKLILTTQIASLNDASGIVGDEGRQESGARAALLTWCKGRTEPLGVKVDNFGKDWKNGMALLALLCSQKPDLINFQALDPTRNEDNLKLAFTVAKNEFGVAPLLDVADLNCDKPDERSVMTYVSAIAHRFEVAAREQSVAEREEQARKKEQLLQQQSQEELERLRAAHVIELDRARQMKEEADRKMEEAGRVQREASQRQLEEGARLEALQKRLQDQEAALLAQANALKAQQQNQAEQADRERREAEALRKRIEEEARVAEQRRMMQLAEQQRLADAARLAEEERLRRQAEELKMEQNRQEQQRLELSRQERQRQEALRQEQQRQEQQRQEQQRQAEQQRVAEQQKLAEQQRQAELQRQQSQANQETIERAFGDAANNMDSFLNQERQKLNDPHLNLETAAMMVNMGFPYGDNLIGRVRGAAQQAITAGLQQNRFTQQNLPVLEQRWSQQKADTQVRLHSLQHPAPVLPAVPFSQVFQPFKITRAKAPMLLLDVTASMNAPVSRASSVPRLAVVKETVKLLVTQMGDAGLRTITFAGGLSHDWDVITPNNFQQKWNGINFEGNTRIMPGWNLLIKAFNDKYGNLPLQVRPVMLALVITDGDSLDIAEFERTLKQDQNSYVVIAIVGFGEEHDAALRSFSEIARTNDRLKVIPVNAAADAPIMAGTLMQLVRN